MICCQILVNNQKKNSEKNSDHAEKSAVKIAEKVARGTQPVREITIPDYLFSRNGVPRKINFTGNEEKQLMIRVPVVVGGKKRFLNVLVDSGAQCDLIRLGLFGEYLRSPSRIMRFKMADGSLMRGGSRSIYLGLAFEREIIDNTPRVWTAKIEFFEAEIGCDAYLSYPTLRRLKLMIISDEGLLARKLGRDRIDRLQPVFPPHQVEILQSGGRGKKKISGQSKRHVDNDEKSEIQVSAVNRENKKGVGQSEKRWNLIKHRKFWLSAPNPQNKIKKVSQLKALRLRQPGVARDVVVCVVSPQDPAVVGRPLFGVRRLLKTNLVLRLVRTVVACWAILTLSQKSLPCRLPSFIL